jgi:uncharacterized protein YcbK (DUF882 family)
MNRRNFLKFAAGLGVLPYTGLVAANPSEHRLLAFRNLHTGEKLKATYWRNGHYDDSALEDINHVLRDHRTGDVYPMEPALLDLLFVLGGTVRAREAFQVISGYRSPKTNARLRKASNGVARRSLHMQGKAIDIRVPGVPLKELYQQARSLRAGGVGYYAASNFIHVDTGRVRYW